MSDDTRRGGPGRGGPGRGGPGKGGPRKPGAGFGGYKGGFRDAPAADDRPARAGRGETPFRKPRAEGERSGPYKPRQDRPRDDRPRGDAPWRERPREERGRDDRTREERPRPFRERPQGERTERPRFAGPRSDRPYGDKPRFDRPREDRPRDERRGEDRPRPPRRDDERPRSASRPERRPFLPREGRPERLANPEKAGGVERIAKVIARAGAASRRDAEEMIEQGRVTVNGEAITSPALDVAPDARIMIDGEPLPARERTRLWLYHKPSGLVTTNHDPEGRTTIFDRLPDDLPRVITIGRLDINTEGLLLLTNDGGLARVLGHPETAWLRRYRVRAYGQITQDKLDAVRNGVTIEGENFGPVVATRDREVGDNTWLTVDLREGKNREVKRVLEHLGLVVNRLIRISFGPFQLGDLAEGEVEEVRTKVLRDQLGDQLASIAGVDFDAPVRQENRLDRPTSRDEERSPGRGGPRAPSQGARFERGERPRFDERGPRRDEGDKPARAPRQGAYHRAREETGDAPRDILLRAEEGRGAIWRDEETTGLKPHRTGPRRGADPRAERSERAQRDAESGRERVRAKPIEDPKGRRVQVERVTGPSPEIPRKPRYTRADFAAPSGEERPFRRPRAQGDRPMGDRPPRAEGDRPFRSPRPDRADGDGFKPRGPRTSFGDGPRPPRAGAGFRDRDERGSGGRGFSGKPPGKGGPSRGGFPGGPKGGSRGAPDRGPRKPRG